MDWIDLAQERDQWRACDHGNEPSSSIKCWENSRVAAQLAASKEGFGSTKLISFSGDLYYDRTLNLTIAMKECMDLGARPFACVS
jgi:hypothetical protein